MILETTWAKLREAFAAGRSVSEAAQFAGVSETVARNYAKTCGFHNGRSGSEADRPTRRKGSLLLPVYKGPDWIGKA
jgi:hypothetical protein